MVPKMNQHNRNFDEEEAPEQLTCWLILSKRFVYVVVHCWVVSLVIVSLVVVAVAVEKGDNRGVLVVKPEVLEEEDHCHYTCEEEEVFHLLDTRGDDTLGCH